MDVPKFEKHGEEERKILATTAEAELMKLKGQLQKQRNLRLLIPFGIFVAGCITEYYTGTRVTTKEDTTTNVRTTLREYSVDRGTGIGWGSLIAAFCL